MFFIDNYPDKPTENLIYPKFSVQYENTKLSLRNVWIKQVILVGDITCLLSPVL